MTVGIDASRANRKEKTGIEWYAYRLLLAMKKITDENRFLLYTDTPLTNELADLPNRWEEKLLRWLPRKFWTQGRLSLEMLLSAPDLLFIPSHVIPIVHPKRVVLTCHDIGFERRPELYAKAELAYHRWSMRYGVRAATHIIAVSEFTKQELMDVYKIPAEKITVIYHGYYGSSFADSAAMLAGDTLPRRGNARRSEGEPSGMTLIPLGRDENSRSGFPPPPRSPFPSTRPLLSAGASAADSAFDLALREENSRGVTPEAETLARAREAEHGEVPQVAGPRAMARELHSRPYFLYVGRIEAKKNLDVVIDAFAQLKKEKKIPDEFRLILTGRLGYRHEETLARAKTLSHNGDIIHVPWVTPEKLSSLYRHATAFLFPSLYEGFGFPLLEALSYGVPVIASDIPALREIGNGAAIFTSPTVDGFAGAMHAMLGDPPTESARTQWKAHSARFSWETAAGKTLTVLRNAL